MWFIELKRLPCYVAAFFCFTVRKKMEVENGSGMTKDVNVFSRFFHIYLKDIPVHSWGLSLAKTCPLPERLGIMNPDDPRIRKDPDGIPSLDAGNRAVGDRWSKDGEMRLEIPERNDVQSKFEEEYHLQVGDLWTSHFHHTMMLGYLLLDLLVP